MNVFDFLRRKLSGSDASNMSHVGKAAYDCLCKHHLKYRGTLWSDTSGRVVGELHQTPLGTWTHTRDPAPEHDQHLPERMGQLISMTEYWCDVTSLAPPDGEFLEEFKKALAVVGQRSKELGREITIRMLFGNILGMPVNCHSLIAELTKDVPSDSKLHLWVGAWRKGTSWNHAKIIAVDGKYLLNGGHNFWTEHYLRKDCVHDVSMEAEGRVALDGHLFANKMWKFIRKKQNSCIGGIVAQLPDVLPLVIPTRVTVSEFPAGKVDEFPPKFKESIVPKPERMHGEYPMLTMGRYGCLLYKARPSDDAFVEIFNSAQEIIRMSLQDLGPVCIPGLNCVALPGMTWPESYLKALGKAIYERGVDVEIVLSNPNSRPNGLSPVEANYGNGWTCENVASEIIKAIRNQYDKIDEDQLRRMILENLRVCYLRQACGNQWQSGMNMGNHAKFFIIDDTAYYVGSQNLYVCDLAEWGILIDDKAQTKKCMDEYWRPMWKESYEKVGGADCDVENVMAGLNTDRNGESLRGKSRAEKKQAERAAAKQSSNWNQHSHFCGSDA